MGVSFLSVTRKSIVFLLFVFASSRTVLAETTVTGIISNDTTWALQDAPFIVADNVTVAAQVTLTIEPGVQVIFNGPYWLKVEGTLLAQGTAVNPIIFASESAGAYWHRLEFLPGSDASILSYVTLSHAGSDSISGSQAYGALYLAGSTPELSHLRILNNQVTGLFAENITTELTLSDSEIIGNTNNTTAGTGAGGVFIEGTNAASVTISDSNIVNNRSNSHGGGLYVAGVGSVLISGNRIADNHAQSGAGGGGIFLANLSGTMNQNVVEFNTIISNIADKDGGGVWMDESQITIRDNVLQANTA
ncbi:MAG: hypothetical protein AMJ53_17410, partial [Gammaproteobacteria bacterium SG8_11]